MAQRGFGAGQIMGGVALLACGVAAAGWLGPALSKASRTDPYAGVPPSIGHKWAEDILGQKVSLPNADLQGFPIPGGRGLFVVTLSCSTCSSLDVLKSRFLEASRFPVIIAVDVVSVKMKEVFGRDPTHFLLVEAASEQGEIPTPMLANAPQAAWIDESGLIVSIPHETQELTDFLRSPTPGAKQ